MRRGRFRDAAQEFERLLASATRAYGIQVLVACREATLRDAVHAVGAEQIYILRIRYRGQPCYRVGWGTFDTESEAREAIRELPPYFGRHGAIGRAVSLESMLPGVADM